MNRPFTGQAGAQVSLLIGVLVAVALVAALGWVFHAGHWSISATRKQGPASVVEGNYAAPASQSQPEPSRRPVAGVPIASLEPSSAGAVSTAELSQVPMPAEVGGGKDDAEAAAEPIRSVAPVSSARDEGQQTVDVPSAVVPVPARYRGEKKPSAAKTAQEGDFSSIK